MDCGSRGEFQESIESRHWKEKLSVYEVWRGYIQEVKEKYLSVAP